MRKEIILLIDILNKYLIDRSEIEEMNNEVKSIQIVDTENFLKILNDKFQNLDKIYKMFEESVGKNKWTSVPNKNLYFNKKIMACYPNFLNNFQDIHISTYDGYNAALQTIKNNKEYKKYGIDWDIQNNKESENSFWNKEHPFNTGYSRIQYNPYLIYQSSKQLKGYNNDPWGGLGSSNSSGLLVPIYRLGNNKDHELFENGFEVFPYSVERIFKIFLENNLVIDTLYSDKNLKKEFEELSRVLLQYNEYIKEFKKKNSKIEIVWNLGKIQKEILENKDKNRLFKNSKIEFNYNNGDKEIKSYEYEKVNGKATYIFKNGDKEEFTYSNGIREGVTNFTYNNGDKEEAKYVNGSLEGKAIYLYKNGDKKEFTYSNNQPNGKVTFTYSNGDREVTNYNSGILSGKSSYTFKNGDKEEREYKDGKLQGQSIYTYTNKNIETRYYTDGVLQGEAILRDTNGEVTRLYYTDGVKKDVTKLYNILNVDKIRVNLDKYDENILADPNRGHWELFENEEKDEIEKSFGKRIYGRDPRLDIKKGGIVGIDFGTKSTVVVFQDGKNITLPMRISGGSLNKKVENDDYENPTVIEFIDIEKFMRDYNSKEGRPLTKWEDITVSHTAFQNLINGTSSQFSSTISDLKQWAGSKKDNLVVRDKQNMEKVFKPYLELEESDIDPIELYAYYIGSYINNLKNGIYLEYFLSFPVTYERAIRERILASFERGIKKSLPGTLINDEAAMKKFRVKHGANEPAAYSVCALQEYGFEPEDDEKVHYGVFDFGGGTLDFDFGIWRASEDERSYDFDLEHFGAGGDKYLGGENILKELAYEVFKNSENIEKLRKENISFARPEWCDKFIGDEGLVDESQEAKLNIKLLMEKLRGLWEGNKEIDYSEPAIKLNLFDKNGKLKEGIKVEFDKAELEDRIAKKIKGGVTNFFIAMERAFKNEEYDKLYILLAGNSCKHPLVMKSFEEAIQARGVNAEILPALGTEEAYAKQEERGLVVDRKDNTKPTGKTGVAYGIVASRSGGRINIINRDESENENNEINFGYYIGYEGRKKFRPILTPQTGYNNFVYLLNVTADVFDLYYSSLPEASEGNMPIDKAKKERVSLEREYEDGEKIYIRAISADTIEYVITKDDIIEKNYLEQGRITLN